MPDLLLCGRCTFWQNKAFSWHQAPLEFLLVCINPASFAFPTHIQCGHTWLSGFMVVLNPVTANVVHFLSPLGVIVKKWNEAFIRPLFRNCLPLTMPVMRKKQRRQHKPVLEGLKMFCRVETEVFLAAASFFSSIMIIKPTVKVHLYYFVFKETMMMMTVMRLILMFTLGWLLLAELKYINKLILACESELFWATFWNPVGLPF